MSDLLSELKELSECNCSDCRAYNSYKEDIRRLVKQYGWHPVSEPPTEICNCLVTEIGINGPYIQIAQWDSVFYTADHWLANRIIAWMLLPEPYKPEAAQC